MWKIIINGLHFKILLIPPSNHDVIDQYNDYYWDPGRLGVKEEVGKKVT